MTDPMKSSIPKCAHKVFCPRGTPGGNDNENCSVCCPVIVSIGPRLKTVLVKDGGQFKNVLKNHPATQ
jgi:hypothetical protein